MPEMTATDCNGEFAVVNLVKSSAYLRQTIQFYSNPLLGIQVADCKVSP